MTLFEHLQFLIKIWTVTFDMTVAKAMNMFLEEERKGEKPKDSEERSAIINAALSGNKNGNGAAGRPICKICDRLYGGVCYIERPDLVSD